MIALIITCALFGLHVSGQGIHWCDEMPYTGHDNALECMNGDLCVADGDNHDDGSWGCCNENDRGGRAKCPNNYPNMCNSKTCANGTAYCCEVDCTNFGGKRPCPDGDRNEEIDSYDGFDDDDDYEALDGEEEDLGDDDCDENDVEDDVDNDDVSDGNGYMFFSTEGGLW